MTVLCARSIFYSNLLMDEVLVSPFVVSGFRGYIFEHKKTPRTSLDACASAQKNAYFFNLTITLASAPVSLRTLAITEASAGSFPRKISMTK